MFAGEDYAVAGFADREDHDDPEAAADSEECPKDIAGAASSCYEGEEEIS